MGATEDVPEMMVILHNAGAPRSPHLIFSAAPPNLLILIQNIRRFAQGVPPPLFPPLPILLFAEVVAPSEEDCGAGVSPILSGISRGASASRRCDPMIRLTPGHRCATRLAKHTGETPMLPRQDACSVLASVEGIPDRIGVSPVGSQAGCLCHSLNETRGRAMEPPPGRAPARSPLGSRLNALRRSSAISVV